MTLYRLIGESAPVIRPADKLTADHPDRSFPPSRKTRDSAWLRAGAFVLVFAAAYILYYSTHMAVVGPSVLSSSLLAVPLGQLVAAVVAYIVLAFVMESRVWPSELDPSRIPGLFKGMLAGALLIVVAVGILALIGDYRITGLNGAYNPWYDLLTMGLIAGVSEEIIFRGVLFRLVEEGLGTWGAVAVSGAVFGAMHLRNPDATAWGAIAIAFEAGILLAGVYALTRSLWWTIGLHFAWNIVEGPVFGSPVSGLGAPDSWLVAAWNGPEILTGGAFGLESSLVAVIVCTLAGVATLVYAQRAGVTVSPMWVRRRLADAATSGKTTDTKKTDTKNTDAKKADTKKADTTATDGKKTGARTTGGKTAGAKPGHS